MKLLQALTLVAGLLWSSVCVAQCRVLPSRNGATSAQKKQQHDLPPCHQKKQQQPTKDCKDDACTVAYADAEKSIDACADVAAPLQNVILVAPASAALPGLEHHAARPPAERPPASISILRV